MGAIGTELIQDSQDYQAAEMVDDAAFDNVGLTDKQIEPSRLISRFVTRNQVMGNVDDGQFKVLDAKKNEAVSLLSIPQSQGGWLAKRFARNIMEGNELTLVMSGSRDGYVRRSLNTKHATISKEERTSSKKGKVGHGIGET